MELPSEPAEGQPLSYVWGVQVVRVLRAIFPRSSPTCRVNTTFNGTTFTPVTGESTGGDIDYSKWCFGFSIVGTTVTLKSGAISFGNAYYIIPDTPFLITQDLQYIGVYATKDAAGTIGPATDVGLFRRDPDTERRWLWQFTLGGGSVQMLRCGLTNIGIPGMGSAAP